MKKIWLALLVVLLSILSSACYINGDVKTDQVGAQLSRNAVKGCVGPGVYTDWGWFSDLREVSVATLTFEVEDPEVATKDNQLVGIRITIQARRKGDCESVKSFLSNWSHLLNDEKLVETIDATAREGIKNGTRLFTLQELLDDRNGLASGISDQVKQDAGKYSTEIINVTVENVAIASEYAATLQKTAQLKAEEDFQKRRQTLVKQQAETDLYERQQQQLVLAEQLKVEQAKTEVEVEIARRAGEIVAASNQVYVDNEFAYYLRQLELLAQIFGDKQVFWFLDPNTDLTTIFNGSELLPILPVETPAEASP